LGHIAGEGVVQRIRSEGGALPAVDMEAAQALRAEASAPLARAEGMTWRELEDATRATVTDYVGVRRSDKELKLALETLRGLAQREATMRADDLHGLMRVHESKNIRLNAELMATASLTRKETRTGSSHMRLDYPRTDEVNWRKFVIVERGASGPTVRTLPTDRPLADAFARGAVTA
jgi:succinate dehydrogenase/fumarate reductase flavoprotein subunit